MHRLGHVGAAMLAYAPVGAYVHWQGEPTLAFLGFGIAVGVSTLPDFDKPLGITHRGPTHTVWFICAVTALLTAIGWLFGNGGSQVLVGAVSGTATALSLSSHLLVDSITPMGIRPLAPVSSFEYSFALVYARDRRANIAFFTAGVLVTVLSQALLLV